MVSVGATGSIMYLLSIHRQVISKAGDGWQVISYILIPIRFDTIIVTKRRRGVE